MARAISSLPVPVSPLDQDCGSVGATLATSDKTLRNGCEDPTISSTSRSGQFLRATPGFPCGPSLRPACDRRYQSPSRTTEGWPPLHLVAGYTGRGTSDTAHRDGVRALQFERNSAGECDATLFPYPFDIVWMKNSRAKFIPAHVIQRQTRVFKDRLICIESISIRFQHGDLLGNRINNGSQFDLPTS